MRPEFHRRGIGRQLLDGIVARFGHVRQMVLLTDAEPAQHAFYRSNGFIETTQLEDVALCCFVKTAGTS